MTVSLDGYDILGHYEIDSWPQEQSKLPRKIFHGEIIHIKQTPTLNGIRIKPLIHPSEWCIIHPMWNPSYGCGICPMDVESISCGICWIDVESVWCRIWMDVESIIWMRNLSSDGCGIHPPMDAESVLWWMGNPSSDGCEIRLMDGESVQLLFWIGKSSRACNSVDVDLMSL